MSVQLTPAQEQRLQHLADESHRTLDELAQESVDRFLVYEEDVRASIKRGREDIENGRLIEHEDVFARINALLRDR